MTNETWDDDPFLETPALREDTDDEDDEELAARLLPADKLSFEVSDADSASWVVRKIVEARARQDRIKEWAAAELKSARREEEWFRERFGLGLEAWVSENLNGKKTLCLPDGTLGYRRKRMTLQIADDEELMEWCKRNLPDAVRVKESILKTPLNEHLQETGEVPPGCELDPGGDEFYVK